MTQRREFIGRLVVAGPTRTMTGGMGGYVVPAEAIREAIDEGLFEGLACFVDHAREGPSLRRLVGVWGGVYWDEAALAAVGRLVAYETELTRPVLDLLEQWLDDCPVDDGAEVGNGPDGADTQVCPYGRPDVGISIVFYPLLGDDRRTVRRIVMIESADLVMFPASVGSRIIGRATSYE